MNFTAVEGAVGESPFLQEEKRRMKIKKQTAMSDLIGVLLRVFNNMIKIRKAPPKTPRVSTQASAVNYILPYFTDKNFPRTIIFQYT